MEKLTKLTPGKSILLAASLASNSNVQALRALINLKSELFALELTCRLLLTFLPEILEPSAYRSLLDQISSRSPADEEHHDYTTIDLNVVEDLSDLDARKLLRSLRLLPLRHPSVPEDESCDLFSQFLIHRAHRIDCETGLLPLVSKLITPFLERSDYLRDWYVGNCIPLLRLDYDYYPSEDPTFNLEAFQKLEGNEVVVTALSKTNEAGKSGSVTSSTAGRDFRGILAPCVYGKTKLRSRKRKRDSAGEVSQPSESAPRAEYPSEWAYTNKWLVSTATSNFPLIVNAIDGWSGPADVDLGLPEEFYDAYQLKFEETDALQARYCQATFASIYSADQDTSETIDGAHSLLVRLSELLELVPPPDLATSVHMLPSIENRTRKLDADLMDFLTTEALLQPDNPLTNPKVEQYSLLQMLVYSAYLLANLGHSISVVKAAKLRFSSEDGEQLRLIKRVLQSRIHGQKKGTEQWRYIRDTIVWLWDWAIGEQYNLPEQGYGIFGKVDRVALETEVLKALCEAEQYALISQTYLNGPASERALPPEEVEKAIVALALHYYDNASNGNKTRGGVKRASDILTAFRSHFAHSQAFKRCNNLISATHALSFYSLRIDPGVPFQPAFIRTTEDPLSLIEKVLEQNTNAYTKLDDLIEIGCNLVRANYSQYDDEQTPLSNSGGPSELDEASELLIAERRVISMAIESALQSNDFETAYSYVVNRLQSPISTSDEASASSIKTDDISWRAALVAGRFRSSAISTQRTNASTTSPHVRGLEQRMELLSHALQLAPPPNLPEVLAAWRRVEEELLSVLAQESEAEQEFDDQADRGKVGMPGSFGALDDRAGSIVQPKRQEFGRAAGKEAPMGLFDVARGAAAAFSRSTSGTVSSSSSKPTGERVSSSASVGVEGRQRKRDVVANAVTGGLASGIGWVLGANPVREEET